MKGIEAHCDRCHQWSPDDDWSYDGFRGTPPAFEDEEWWWECPLCHARTIWAPEERKAEDAA